MALVDLDHVNLRTRQLAEMVDFYSHIGLSPGPRPPFAFGGAWLYCGSRAVVHLVEVDQAPAGQDPSLEHFALRGENMDAFLALLDGAGIDYRIGVVPGYGTRQVNIFDPDGNHLHVDFELPGEAS